MCLSKCWNGYKICIYAIWLIILQSHHVFCKGSHDSMGGVSQNNCALRKIIVSLTLSSPGIAAAFIPSIISHHQGEATMPSCRWILPCQIFQLEIYPNQNGVILKLTYGGRLCAANGIDWESVSKMAHDQWYLIKISILLLQDRFMAAIDSLSFPFNHYVQ